VTKHSESGTSIAWHITKDTFSVFQFSGLWNESVIQCLADSG
jgi:hypothetical protein